MSYREKNIEFNWCYENSCKNLEGTSWGKIKPYLHRIADPRKLPIQDCDDSLVRCTEEVTVAEITVYK